MRIEREVRLILAFLIASAGTACAPRQIDPKDLEGKDPTPIISATPTPEPLPTLIPTPTRIKPKEMTNPELIKLLENLNRKYSEDLRQAERIVGESPIINLCRALPEIEIKQATGVLTWPTYGYISQGFSRYHPAIDLASGYGRPVYAADGGIVAGTFYDPYGLGLHILLFHGNGKMTVSSHLSEIKVGTGQYIEKGGEIGKTGTTGRSTGPHLDFAAIVSCEYVDPLKLLPR